MPAPARARSESRQHILHRAVERDLLSVPVLLRALKVEIHPTLIGSEPFAAARP